MTDWRKATRFYDRFGITEESFRKGVPEGDDEARSLRTDSGS